MCVSKRFVAKSTEIFHFNQWNVFRAPKQSKKSEFRAQNNQRKMLPIHLLILRLLVDFKSCILFFIFSIKHMYMRFARTWAW